MSKLYAIYAYEQVYSGYYGICNHAIIEANSDDDAIDYAQELSCEVIEEYCLDTSDEYECINSPYENTAYEIWELKDIDLTISQIEKMWFNDRDGFIKEYAIKKI